MEEKNFPSKKLKGIGQLLKESWIFYCAKIKTALGILIMPVGFSVLSRLLINFLALSGIVYSFWFSVISAFIFLASIFLWLWATLSLICGFKEDIGVKESYKKGSRLLFSYIWLFFLLSAIIIGGFLLFIIPGPLFAVWFGLALFVFVFEEKKGFTALHKSKQLISGKFWGVLLRLLVSDLLLGVGLFLIGFLATKQPFSFIGYLLILLILPFFFIYRFLLYKNLSEIKSGTFYPEAKKLSRIKYALPGILGALIIGLFFSASFFNIFWGRDIPPVDDSDLRLSKVEIPEEENAFFLLFQAGEKLNIIYERHEISFDEMAVGEKWDDEFARELIENNQEFFELFDKAMELPFFQFPEFQDPETIGIDVVIPGISVFRNMARLNSIKANYLFIEGEEEESLDLIIKTLKMGQLLQDTPVSPFINYLVGLAIKDVGLQRLRIIIPGLTLSPEAIKNYIIQLDQFKENEQGLVTSWKTEYMFFSKVKAVIDKTFSGQLSTEDLKKELEWLVDSDIELFSKVTPNNRLNYFYKPNQTQQIFVEYYRNNIADANKDCYQIKPIEIELQIPLYGHPLKMLFTENVIGKILYDITAVSLGNVFYPKCSRDFSITGTQLLLAMKAFQADNGRLPASSDELVPEYLSDIPKDPFDGQPIRYSSEDKTIFSPQGNIVFQINF